jgi:hypothetical protein
MINEKHNLKILRDVSDVDFQTYICVATYFFGISSQNIFGYRLE